MTLPLATITSLLDDLKKLPPMRPHKQTFMEISGYPHFENVCSNILQFYLQPTNEHGFDTLFLDSLISVAGQKLTDNTEEVDIRREELTANNNRIDLVIETDEYIIGIENKIFAPAYNDFKDYMEYLKLLANGRHISGILLSLRPLKPSPDLYGFIPVSYEQFLQRILSNFGSYIITAQEPHLTFFRDFVRTLQNLQETTAMDRQRLAYFHENQVSIKTLLTEIDSLYGDMRYKVKQVEALLDPEVFSSLYPISHGLWRSKTDLVDIVWCHLRLSSSLSLQFNVRLTLDGWSRDFFNRKGFSTEIKRWMTEREIEVEEGSPQRLECKGEILPYETEPEEVREWAFTVFEKLIATTP